MGYSWRRKIQRFNSFLCSRFIHSNISKKSSFDNITKWINFIRNIENNTLVLCGNKIDLSEREVKKEEGEALAQKEKIAFFEVSAKTGKGIKNMFYTVVDLSILNGCKLTKENLEKELLQENENEKENENENKNENENENENKNENKNENENENENENGNGDTAKLINNDNFTYTKNTERCSLCSRCINCCKNCFNSD